METTRYRLTRPSNRKNLQLSPGGALSSVPTGLILHLLYGRAGSATASIFLIQSGPNDGVHRDCPACQASSGRTNTGTVTNLSMARCTRRSPSCAAAQHGQPLAFHLVFCKGASFGSVLRRSWAARVVALPLALQESTSSKSEGIQPKLEFKRPGDSPTPCVGTSRTRYFAPVKPLGDLPGQLPSFIRRQASVELVGRRLAEHQVVSLVGASPWNSQATYRPRQVRGLTPKTAEIIEHGRVERTSLLPP